MDVSQEEVIKVIKEHSVSLLIHGHTHRPNTHEIATDNLSAKRIVLGDWDKHGWYIWMDSNSCELRKFSIFQKEETTVSIIQQLVTTFQ